MSDPAERAAERILKQSYGYMSELKKGDNVRAAEMVDIIRAEYMSKAPNRASAGAEGAWKSVLTATMI